MIFKFGESSLMLSTKPFNWVALVDCNNFFVSVERLFDPNLMKKPVVILSTNDGCIISRSEEAKAFGIPMGAPFFEWKEFLEKRGVIYRSSNFPLYADMSNRVMQTLAELNPEIEIYSVDEAFLFFEDKEVSLASMEKLREIILKWIGIPVSIGIAPTKTLAKAAGKRAKKTKKGAFGLFTKEQIDNHLSTLATEDIWGIGRRISAFLAKRGIKSALDFANQDEAWIKKHLSVTSLKTALELRGIPCLIHEEIASKQSIMTSRSFGTFIYKKEEIAEALSNFATRGAEKLREEGCRATFLDVFIMTSYGIENFYGNQAHITFPEPTNYTPDFIHAAKKGLEAIFRPDLPYKRGGVLLGGLVPETAYQRDLFQMAKDDDKKVRLMEVLDHSKAKFGYDIIQYASSGTQREKPMWKSKRDILSPCYTTRWSDLLTII